MIVITGTPRSGTSWAMQDCIHLGIDVVGEPFSPGNSPARNVKGYWELPLEQTMEGVHRAYKGVAIKLFGTSLINTPTFNIERVIVCKRKKKDAIKSYIKFLKDSEEETGVEPIRKNAEYLFDVNKIMFEAFLEHYPDIPYMEIDFDKKLSDPEYWVNEMAKFLLISDEKKIENAILNAGV